MMMTPWLIVVALAQAPKVDDVDEAKLIAGLEAAEKRVEDFSLKAKIATTYADRADPKVMKSTTFDGEFIGDAAGRFFARGATFGPKGNLERVEMSSFDGEEARSTSGFPARDQTFKPFAHLEVPDWVGVGVKFDYAYVKPQPDTFAFGGDPWSYMVGNRKWSTSTAGDLKESGVESIRPAEWEGRPVLEVRGKPGTTNGTTYRSAYLVDPARGFDVVRVAGSRKRADPAADWEEFAIGEKHDLAEVAPGVWAPGRFTSEGYAIPADAPRRFISRKVATLTDWKVNVHPRVESFRLPFPPGVMVVDEVRKQQYKAPEDKAPEAADPKAK